MNVQDILTQLRQQRDNVQQAIDALEGLPTAKGGKRKRQMSADARARIAAAQRKRWAAQKRQAA